MTSVTVTARQGEPVMTATATVTADSGAAYAATTVTARAITRSTAPLVLTRDVDQVDAMQRIPGLAFTVLAGTPVEALNHWDDAPLVIVSADQVAPALAADLPARHLVVVTNDRPADLAAVATLVTDHGGHHYRADVVPLEYLADVLPRLYEQAGA